ncbi:MAG: UbiA family prenyltransferase [Salinisphaeraceae bacterium]|nr:UbiA family prenyltransferase [Salinisphaeraceae bacterium]
MSQSEPTLYVDLDGTLIHTDMLFESALALLRRNPFYVFVLPFWLLGGRPHLKAQIAERVQLDIARLPWNRELLGYLTQEKQRGRRIVLATASDQRFAHQVAVHLNLFDAVLASDGLQNLDGKRKLVAIGVDSDTPAFDYVGNARADLPLWAAARQSYVATASKRVRNLAKQKANVIKEFNVLPNRLSACYRAMRFHQWLKNLLVFLPVVASHQWGSPQVFTTSLLAFFAFGFVASSGYWANDLLDIESDRQHPQKNKRPFASGDLPILWGVLGVPILLLVAILTSLLLPWDFLIVIAVYYVLTLFYSLWLKRLVMLDVTVLALLYTLRILAGAAATGIVPSFWMLAFSMFLFLGLAILKRYTEFMAVKAQGEVATPQRGYETGDLPLLGMLGASSSLLSVLVLALYINSDAVRILYAQSELIWFMCPLLIYWTGRMWFKAHRGQMHHDPVVFAARDPVSWFVVGLAAAVFLLAR